MLRAVSWTLGQRRYRMLALVMLVVAVGCAGAGTFELHRYREKQHDNAALRANAHAPAAALTPSLAATTASGAGSGAAGGAEPGAGSGDALRFRSVVVSGTYERRGERYVDDQYQGGVRGFLVLTPLRTDDAVLLVARGFVAQTAAETRPASIPAAPTGPVRVVGRLTPSGAADERAGVLGHGEITAVNPTQQAARLGTAVYRDYLRLDAGQAGGSGLRALSAPDLSNPTGGARSWQLASYVVQWFVFALLALIAPFFFARADARDAQRRFLGIDSRDEQFDLARAGRRQLAASGAGDGSGNGGALVRRARGEVASGAPKPPRLVQAEALADRYGRSLGPDAVTVPADAAPFGRGAPWRAADTRNAGVAPHRSADTFHGSYNDYLWQLALADGSAPDVLPADVVPADVIPADVPPPGDEPAVRADDR